MLAGTTTPDFTTQLMGRTYPLPFGFAPVGMSGLMWPGAELILARAAAKAGIPFCLSTVAAETPETVGPKAGDQGWFQLYPPGDPDIRRDMLARAKDAGFHTLILTVDVATASRRERQLRARLTNPMRMTPRVIAQAAIRPQWALETLTRGIPRLKTLEKYAEVTTARSSTAHIGYLLRTAPDWDYLAALRDEWDGKLVVKGVMEPDAAAKLPGYGVDAIWVSNHGGRQFDASPASLDVLPAVKAAAGDTPVIFDSGIRSGTDILRALALGADFVMLGRAPHYAVAAFGRPGVDHLIDILTASMTADMGQMALTHLADLPSRLVR